MSGACRGGDAPAADAVRPVKVETATDAAYIDKDFVGLATPDNAVNLAFKLSGQLLAVPVAQGQEVRRGELLAELDPRDVRLQADAGRSAYEQARSNLQRIGRLLEHGAVSQQEYEAAQTHYVQVKSSYDNMLDLLGETRLRAPFNSVVEAVYVDAYQRVQAGETVIRVVAPHTTTVKFTLPESGLGLLASPQTSFSVEFDSYRGVKFPARLKEYAKTSSDASGFPVSLRLDDSLTRRWPVSPGMSCTITLRSADPVAGAVSLPLTAVCAPAQGGEYVWVVGPGDTVGRHRVRLGELCGRDRVIVDSGVMPGQRVVVAGVYRLQEGDRVRILD